MGWTFTADRTGVAGGANLITSASTVTLGWRCRPRLIVHDGRAPPIRPARGPRQRRVSRFPSLATGPAIGAGNPVADRSRRRRPGAAPVVQRQGGYQAYEARRSTSRRPLDSGNGSLRSVVAIDDDNSPIYIDPSLSGKAITLTRGPIVLNHSVTIAGPGAALVSVDVQDGPVTDSTLVGLWKRGTGTPPRRQGSTSAPCRRRASHTCRARSARRSASTGQAPSSSRTRRRSTRRASPSPAGSSSPRRPAATCSSRASTTATGTAGSFALQPRPDRSRSRC